MIVLTRPQGNVSGITGTNNSGLIIPPTTGLNVDDIPFATNVAVKWIYVIRDLVLNRVRTAEVLATHRNGTSPVFNVFSSIGDPIPHSVSVQIIGVNFRLSITNNGANPLHTSIVRIQVTI